MDKPAPPSGVSKAPDAADPAQVKLPYLSFFKPGSPEYLQEVADYQARQKRAPTKSNTARVHRGALKLEHQQSTSRGIDFFFAPEQPPSTSTQDANHHVRVIDATGQSQPHASFIKPGYEPKSEPSLDKPSYDTIVLGKQDHTHHVPVIDATGQSQPHLSFIKPGFEPPIASKPVDHGKPKSHVGEIVNGVVKIVATPPGYVSSGPVDFFKKEPASPQSANPKKPNAGMKFTP